LGNVEGVDGIKTGYTEASGYNLLSSVHRSDRYIVAVVLGETSNSARDARMRALIEENIRLASAQRMPAISAGATALGQADAKINGAAPAAVKPAPGLARTSTAPALAGTSVAPPRAGTAPALAGTSRIIDNFEQ
jgi:D-alanyl-D-alanine carboxypeptidase